MGFGALVCRTAAKASVLGGLALFIWRAHTAGRNTASWLEQRRPRREYGPQLGPWREQDERGPSLVEGCPECVELAVGAVINTTACMQRVIRKPALGPWRRDPVIAMDTWLMPIRPTYTITMSIHNSVAHVSKMLPTFAQTARGAFELVLVVDGSVDGSLVAAVRAMKDEITRQQRTRECTPAGSVAGEDADWFKQKTLLYKVCSGLHPSFGTQCGKLVHVRIINQPTGVWETAANNIAACLSVGTYIALCQDDMYMTQVGWNVHQSLPHRLWPDIISVTARCAHDKYGGSSGGIGKCTPAMGIEKPVPEERWPPEAFHVRDSSNRGPLLVDTRKMATLGYLDEQYYYGPNPFDEHNLHYRAFDEHQWVTGLYETEFFSKLDWGKTRNGDYFNEWEDKRPNEQKKSMNGFKNLKLEREYTAYREKSAVGTARRYDPTFQVIDPRRIAARDYSDREIQYKDILKLANEQHVCVF